MTTREHAVDPSTLPDFDLDDLRNAAAAPGGGGTVTVHAHDLVTLIEAAHRADECPPADRITTPPPLNQCLLKGEHEAHLWWYTSCGGGHMLDRYDPTEKPLKAHVCPGIEPAEQWRQDTPEEVREGWLGRLTAPDGKARLEGIVRDFTLAYSEFCGWEIDYYVRRGWTLLTTEPADPTAERRRLIEAATGLNAETLEANLADKGLAIVRAEEVPGE